MTPTTLTKELVFFPKWMAGRAGYAERIHEVLRAHEAKTGLRHTRQRETIVDYLLNAEQHVSQVDIYQALKSKGIGKVTVFRTLKMLEECHLIERVNAVDGTAKYEITHERPHHDHLVCIECGSIKEVQWPEVEKIQEKACRALGFAPTFHRHEVFGRCSDCQKRLAIASK